MEPLHLELYVLGPSSRSRAAIVNLERICRQWLGAYELSIIDVLDEPEAAESANIVATPTLIRRTPGPARRLVGDLHSADAVRLALGIKHDSSAVLRRTGES